MKREHWIYHDSNLIVEKYSKVLTLENFEQLDGKLITLVDKKASILHLVDLSEASLFNLEYGDITTVYNGLLHRLGKIENVKLAIYCGENGKSDFMKISAFSKYENDKLQIKLFVELIDALNWLAPTPNDRANAWKMIH